MFLTGFTSLNVLLPILLSITFFCLDAQFLILFHPTQILINPSTNVFGDFNVYHKDRFTYSSRMDRPGELL